MSAAVSEAVRDAVAMCTELRDYAARMKAGTQNTPGANYYHRQFSAMETCLAALQEGSGALPASPDVFELADALENTGVAIGVSTWPDEQRRDAVILAEAAINALGPWLSGTAPDAPQVGIREANEAQSLRSEILERIRAFDFRAHYGEAEYERLADDLKALPQPNQPRDREEG